MGTIKKLECLEILLVEDNPADVELTRIAMEEGKLLNSLSVAGDGVEAMDFLHRRGKYANAPRPDIILLDLNLPRKDGREVLREIKESPDLGIIPVIVLTSSPAEEDVLRSYRLHANSYISKPVDLDAFINTMRTMGNYWISIVKLPAKE